jgi:hypothetical protein
VIIVDAESELRQEVSVVALLRKNWAILELEESLSRQTY